MARRKQIEPVKGEPTNAASDGAEPQPPRKTLASLSSQALVRVNSLRSSFAKLVKLTPMILQAVVQYILFSLFYIFFFAIPLLVIGSFVVGPPTEQVQYILLTGWMLYAVILACLVAFCAYLYVIWVRRSHFSKFALYLLIGAGGSILVPTTALIHYKIYSQAPQNYVIPADKLAYVGKRNQSAVLKYNLEVQDLSGFRKNLRAVTTKLRASSKLHYSSRSSNSSSCRILDLGRETGLLCVERVESLLGPPPGVDIHIDNNLRATDQSPNLTTLLITGGSNNCELTFKFLNIIGDWRKEMQTKPVLACLMQADAILVARQALVRKLIKQASQYPEVPYDVFLVDSAAAMVGARYSVVEPAAPVAGMVNVVSSLLSIIYFVAFASLLLEDRPDRSRGLMS